MRNLSEARQGPRITASAALRTLGPACRHILRGEPSVITGAAAALGLALPATCRASARDQQALLWLGPDEFLLITPPETIAAVAAALEPALNGAAHSCVEVSHRQVALELAGPLAATVLAAGCPLDLDVERFPIGMCTRTLFGKAEIVLWRVALETFHLEVARSFAAYVSRLVAVAAREYKT
jgi:sarcosine oxidase, subunit gamma